ncbi:MAG: polymerase [Treponema sp.]|nr:polymerase [Treponema sp.]
MNKIIASIFVFFLASAAFAEVEIGISGSVNWETMRLEAEISLDLASAGLKLPAGRIQAEALLEAEYTNQLRPHLMKLQVDSSSTVGDLVGRGDLSLLQTDTIMKGSSSVPPAMRPNLLKMSIFHSISLSNTSASLLRHTRPIPIVHTLLPVSAASYTGIIIIAAESLPIHGMRSSTLAVPCLFPKIWDNEMNLIYDRNILETKNSGMVRYASLQSIFQRNPSGLTDELRQFAGEKPLRIFARGVFGINPTDIIIERSDALLIISNEENRRLLSQGKVVIILDDSVLKYDFGN